MEGQKIEDGCWYTDKQVAKHFGIGRSTLWAWVSRGFLPEPVKVGPRTTRFKGEDLLNFVPPERVPR